MNRMKTDGLNELKTLRRVRARGNILLREMDLKWSLFLTKLDYLKSTKYDN
jgi:hypothetical protein